ncbi:MAG: hypothetical protein IID45_09755 [Planctomycetes bacterium]|nr:hypothetical protein [Planctomycetota bacterium]
MSRTTSAILERPAAYPEAGAQQGLVARVTAWLRDPVAGKGAVSIFDQGIVSGTSFVTSVLIGRFCTQADLGVYYLALSIVLFVRGVQEQVVSAPYTVYLNRHRGDALAAFGGSSLMHQFALAALAMLGLTGLALAATAGYGANGFSTVSWILIGTIPFLLLREHLRQFAFARLKIGMAVRIDVAVALLQLGSLAVLTAWGVLSVPAVFLVMGGSCAAATLGWFLFRQQPLRFERKRILSDWRDNWRFSKWALSSHLVGSSTPYIMPWFVAAVRGTAATGVMAACSTIVGLANVFVMGLRNYFMPRAAHAFAEGGVVELRRVLRKTSLIFAVTLGAFSALSFVAGDFLAVFVYGENTPTSV